MPTFDLILRNGHVVLDDEVRQADVAIEGGRFAEIGNVTGGARETVDAAGLHVFPGLIDPHVHFNEPGRTDWEGIATGSAALAAGGGTCFFDMPLNSNPPVLSGAEFDAKRTIAETSSVTDFALWGGLTPDNLARLDELAERGVIGFKAFMSNSGIAEFNNVDDWTLYRGMQIAAKHGLVVAVHAENDVLAAGFTRAAIDAGKTSMADYLQSRPGVVEIDAVQRALAIAQAAGCKVHIVHVSTWQAAALVKTSRFRFQNAGLALGADASCETCPHYLLLNADDAIAIGPAAKCSPPIRSEADRLELLHCLMAPQPYFDFVGSDHSPSPASMKRSPDAFKNWGGIAGVQSTLSALLTLDVGEVTVGKLTAKHVARRFGLKSKGEIAPGMDADFSLVNVRESFTLERRELLDRHKLSPYVGRSFRGRIVRTVVRGTTIFETGKIVSPPIGQLVRPAV